MKQLKRLILKALAQGAASGQFLDQLLSMEGADPANDLRVVFARADLDRLLLLRARLDEGDVIKGAYRRPSPDGQDQGCLHYWLASIRSNEALLNQEFPSKETLRAVCRTTRHWDFGFIDEETIRAVLDETIAERERVTLACEKYGQPAAPTDEVLAAAVSVG